MATDYTGGNFASVWDLSRLHDALLFKFQAPEDMWWHKQLTGILSVNLQHLLMRKLKNVIGDEWKLKKNVNWAWTTS